MISVLIAANLIVLEHHSLQGFILLTFTVDIATKLEEEKTQGSRQEMSYPLLVKYEEMSCFGNRTCRN